jgi:hypothetical protein
VEATTIVLGLGGLAASTATRDSADASENIVNSEATRASALYFTF